MHYNLSQKFVKWYIFYDISIGKWFGRLTEFAETNKNKIVCEAIINRLSGLREMYWAKSDGGIKVRQVCWAKDEERIEILEVYWAKNEEVIINRIWLSQDYEWVIGLLEIKIGVRDIIVETGKVIRVNLVGIVEVIGVDRTILNDVLDQLDITDPIKI